MLQRPLALTLLAGLALSWLGGPAAKAADITEHRPVHRGTLDIGRDRDAQLMAGRIGEAALEVCGAGRGSLQIVRAAVLKSECWNQAVEDAVAQLGAPKVTAALAAAQGR